jgi:hypothetical protein
MTFLILLSALGLHVASAQTPYVPPTQLLRKGGHQIGISVDNFTSQKTMDEKGRKVDDGDGYSFTRTQGEVSGFYGATNDLQFGVGLRYRHNHANQYTATGSGFESTFFNVKYGFKMVDRLKYTLEGMFRYRPFSAEVAEIDSDPSNLILGDDGNEISGGLGVTYFSPKNNYVTVKAGYRQPGRDVSDQAYGQIEGALVWKNAAVIAGVDVVSAIHNDPYADNDVDRPVFNTGSQLYKSKNPEWVAPYLGLNIALGHRWRLELQGSQVVYARSMNLGTGFGVNLIRRIDKDPVRFVDNNFKTYDIEGSVTKISPKQGFVVIDKGLGDGVQKGMRFDFFEFD